MGYLDYFAVTSMKTIKTNILPVPLSVTLTETHLNLPSIACHRFTSTSSAAAYTDGRRRTWKRQSNARHQSCHWCLQNAKCYQKYSWTWSSGALSFPQAKLSFQLTVAFNNMQTKKHRQLHRRLCVSVVIQRTLNGPLLMVWYLMHVLKERFIKEYMRSCIL